MADESVETLPAVKDAGGTAPPSSGARPRLPGWLKRAALTTVAVVLVVGLLCAWQAFQLRRDLVRARAELNSVSAAGEPLLADSGSSTDARAFLTDSRAHIKAADEALASAQRRERLLRPALVLFSYAPGWPRGVTEVRPLLDAAREATRAGRILDEAALSLLDEVDRSAEGEPVGARLSRGLTAAEPDFRRALEHLAAAQAHRRRVDTAHLDGPLTPARSAVAQFDERFDDLYESAVLLTQLPTAASALLGMDQPKTYAILGQNSAELRPTGGFLGTMGLVTVQNAKPIVEDYRSTYDFERPERGYPPAPEALARYIGGDGEIGWGLRDANWSPDFPTTARTVEAMLYAHQDVRVDGVIGFTNYAVGGLLRALGPLTVPGIDEPVTEESWYALAERAIFGDQPNVQVVSNSQENKREVLSSVLRAIVVRIQSARQEDLTGLLRAVRDLVREKQLLLSFHDPAVMEIVRRYDADGRFAPPPGDVLGVIDANLSYSKIAPYVDESIEYDVWLNDAAVPTRSLLTVTYKNSVKPSEAVDSTLRIGGQEFDRTAGAFRSLPGFLGTYVRVYVPANSRVLESEGDALDLVSRKELGFASFEHYERIPAGTTRQFRVAYQIPQDSTERGTYRLTILKQPGTRGHALTVRVHVPPDKRVEASPSMKREQNVLVFSDGLTAPRELFVRVTDR